MSPISMARPRSTGSFQKPGPRFIMDDQEIKTMFLSKRHIPRRTFLRGAGVTLALPLLA
jgi:hypothetical protein